MVPHSVGAGAVLHIAIFSHVMNYISHSSSDRNCLAHLKGWKKCGSQQVLVCTAEVWEVRELGSVPRRAVDLCLPALISPCTKQLQSFSIKARVSLWGLWQMIKFHSLLVILLSVCRRIPSSLKLLEISVYSPPKQISHRIIESFGLEKTLKIMKSKHHLPVSRPSLNYVPNCHIHTSLPWTAYSNT